MDQKWFKYTYVCHTCDALIEYTLELSNIPADVDVTQLTCVCGGIAGQLSVEDATIGPSTTNERKEMQVTDMYVQEMELKYGNEITELKNQLDSLRQNREYYLSENGRIQSQLIELVTNYYEDEIYEASDIVKTICEIIDFEPKREVSFTATITVEGRADVPFGEDVQDYLEAIEFSVDAYNGDVIITNDSLSEIEEC